jgi:hypothetical protein
MNLPVGHCREHVQRAREVELREAGVHQHPYGH